MFGKKSLNSMGKSCKAFTLVELLVVISIIALLLSILMPSLAKARENAKNVICMSNIRFLGVCLAIYTNENNNSLPSGAVVDERLRTTGSHQYWSDALLATSRGKDERVLKGIITCPSKKYIDEEWERYGYGWNFDYFGYKPSQIYKGWGTKITNVPDPTTLLVGDNSDEHLLKPVLTQPTVIFPATKLDILKTVRHKNGGNYLGVDGHVEHMTWKTLMTDRKVFHTGITTLWGAGYDYRINHRFTPARD